MTRAGRRLALLAIALALAVSLPGSAARAQQPPAVAAQPSQPSQTRQPTQPSQTVSARCVVLELYTRASDAAANDSVAAIRSYVAQRRGVHLKHYDLDRDPQSVSRLKTLATAYKLGDPQLPLVYGLNTTASSIASDAVWRTRLAELLRMEVFTRKGCPRCAKAKEYLPSFIQKYPGIEVQVYEASSDPQSNKRFAALAARQRVGAVSYPGFWICQQLVVGFDNEKAAANRLDAILKPWTFECKLAAAGGQPHRREPIEPLISGRRHQALPDRGFVTPAAYAYQSPLPSGEEAPLQSSSLLSVAKEPESEFAAAREQALPLPGETRPSGFGETDLSASEGRGEEEAMEVPWLGRVSVQELGMPLFTLAIGLIDGFNPCAMWVLLFLLSVLVNLQDRWKILAVAGTFVAVSGLAYFAFMAAWLNVLLLVGFLRWVQIALALLAIFVGSVHIKDYFAFKQGLSLSIPESAKPRIYDQVRRVVTAQNLTAAIVGAVALAVLVNVIELLCTAGLPALYTQILSQQGYPSWKHYAYLGLYIAAYMFDDSVMVGIVVVTLGRHKLQETEGRWLKLVGGLVILGLGLVLLFKPQWLD